MASQCFPSSTSFIVISTIVGALIGKLPGAAVGTALATSASFATLYIQSIEKVSICQEYLSFKISLVLGSAAVGFVNTGTLGAIIGISAAFLETSLPATVSAIAGGMPGAIIGAIAGIDEYAIIGASIGGVIGGVGGAAIGASTGFTTPIIAEVSHYLVEPVQII